MLDQDIVEIASLLHHEWSVAMDLLDKVKKETNDGSPDWAAFHDANLIIAQTRVVKAQAIRDRFTEEFRETIMKSMGF